MSFSPNAMVEIASEEGKEDCHQKEGNGLSSERRNEDISLLTLSIISQQKDKLEELTRRVVDLEKRNIVVDTRKQWESSYTRMFCIIIITYVLIFLYLNYSLHVANAAADAVVPAIGFTLSAASLSIVKPIWERVNFGLKESFECANRKWDLIEKLPPAAPLPLV